MERIEKEMKWKGNREGKIGNGKKIERKERKKYSKEKMNIKRKKGKVMKRT